MTIDAATVRFLLNDLGQTVTFKRVTEGSYDPDTGQTGASTTDTEDALVAFVDYEDRFIDGAVIRRGDRRALMAATAPDGSALDKTPQPGDRFTGVGDEVQIVNVRILEPGGTVAGYECQVRE